MATSLDLESKKLDKIVNHFIDGKRNGMYSLGPSLTEIFGQAAAKLDFADRSAPRATFLERVLTVKGVFDWKRIKAVLESFEAESHLNKSAEISTKLRERGNDLYKEKKIDRALRAYTLAIAFAPVSSEELGTAYANRSAVLLQMNKVHEALADVERSLPKCPQKLKDKMEERADKCKAMLEKLKDGEIGEDDGRSTPEKLFEIHQHNPKIPNAQCFVEMVYTPQRGRHLVVTEDVPAGSVVLTEQPYVSVLSNLLVWEIDHCHHCAKSMINGIQCNECVFAMFCSEECRELACTGVHRFEHSYLPILHASHASHKDIQSLRIVAAVGHRFLLELWKTNDSMYFTDNISKDGDMLGFDEDGIYDSTNYLSTFHLISHELESVLDGGVPVATLNAMNAIFLKNLLKEYSNFFQPPPPGEAQYSLEDFEDFVASIILRHLENIKFNAISLSKMSKDNKKSIAFAAAMYPLLSICNHSCDPNCAPVKQSKYLRTSLISIKHLKKGDELFITYKPLYTQMKTSDRQTFLADNYRFICNCQPCEENWGPSSVQRYPTEGMLILEPTKCDSCVEAGMGKNGNPCQCRSCAKKDVQRAKKIRGLVQILFECHDLVEKKDYVKNLKVLPEVINYFGNNGYQSYFSLYYIAIDLFKRALVQCVSVTDADNNK